MELQFNNADVSDHGLVGQCEEGYEEVWACPKRMHRLKNK